jgi:hypothetical protein
MPDPTRPTRPIRHDTTDPEKFMPLYDATVLQFDGSLT